MLVLIQALAPIFLLVLLGYLLRSRNFPGTGFWPVSERLTYYVLFPALLVDSLARAELQGLPVLKTAGCMIVALLLLSLLLLLLHRRIPVPGPAFSSLFQGSIRPNTYVGLSGAWALFGGEGVTFAAIAILAIVPVVNFLSVSVVSYFGDSDRDGLKSIGLELVRNPLIIACIVGILLNWTDFRLPLELPEVIHVLGRASLPMGLLAVGAGLRFQGVFKGWLSILVSSTAKMALLPVLAAALCLGSGLSGTAAGIAILFTAIPTSASSYILARQLGGDHQLMAAILTAQTALAALLLPAMLSFLLPWTTASF